MWKMANANKRLIVLLLHTSHLERSSQGTKVGQAFLCSKEVYDIPAQVGRELTLDEDIARALLM